jgi:hypothetical protein
VFRSCRDAYADPNRTRLCGGSYRVFNSDFRAPFLYGVPVSLRYHSGAGDVGYGFRIVKGSRR